MGFFSNLFGGNQDYDAYVSGAVPQWQKKYGQAQDLRIADVSRDLTKHEQRQLQRYEDQLKTLETQINADPAARLDLREFQREGAVKLGGAGIDHAFQRFNDDYFDDFVDDYRAVYSPQIAQQYDRAKGKMAATLADRGIGESTVAAHGFGNLLKQNNDANTQVASEAQNAAANLRSSVEQSKQNLHSLNLSAADPAAASAQANAAATTLIQPPQYSMLGDVFSAALQPYMAFRGAYNNRSGPRYQSPYQTGLTGGSGSGSIVN